MSAVVDFINLNNESSNYQWMVITGGIFLFLLGFGIGANDTANNFGTSVGSGSLKLWQATILAAIFESIGAIGLGGTVAESIRKSIVDFRYFENTPSILMVGMLTAMMSATLWLFLASFYSLPVSTTHSIVGAILGFGLATGNLQVIDWESLGLIVLSWITSPLLSGILSMLFYFLLRKFLLRSPHALIRAKRTLWIFIYLLCATFSLYIIFKNSIRIPGISCPADPCVVKTWVKANILYAILLGFGIAIVISAPLNLLAYYITNRSLKSLEAWKKKETLEGNSKSPEKVEIDIICRSQTEGIDKDQTKIESSDDDESPASSSISLVGEQEKPVQVVVRSKLPWMKEIIKEALEESQRASELHSTAEKFSEEIESFFSSCQVFSACFAALAHGANDTANAVGPFASIYGAFTVGLKSKQEVPYWILAIGGVSIAVGLALLGYRVLKTIGCKLLKISPSRGFCIEVAAAWIIIIFSNLGVPLSTTHCLVGAAVGVGLIDYNSKIKRRFSFSNVNIKLCLRIFAGWILTIVIAAVTTASLFSFSVYSPNIAAIDIVQSVP